MIPDLHGLGRCKHAIGEVRFFGIAVQCVVMWCRCLQHQMALTLSVMIVYLNIVCPLFCACRILQDGKHLRDLRRAVRCAIEYELVFDDKHMPLDADSIRTKTLVEELLCGRHAVSGDLYCLARGLHEI